MALTSKDLHIIKQALDHYYQDMEGNDFLPGYHKKLFGNPDKTIKATRQRVQQMIEKRERTCG